MHDLNFFLDLVSQQQGVCFLLGGTENDGLTNTSIADKDVSQG
jgi:hypothetical protein